MSKRTELKPCPFCGAKADGTEDSDIAILDRSDRYTKRMHVWCIKCDVRGPQGKSVPEARKLWNTRAP